MLPFESISEAETFLGRNLTFAEGLWFEYSSCKSDFLLYCHNIAFLFVFYSILPLPYMLLELARSNKIDRFKIQRKVRNSMGDMLVCYRKVMVNFVFAIVPMLIVSYPLFKIVGIRTGLPLPAGTEMFLRLVVYFMIEDYTNYWFHRLLHCKWGFENIHHVHHEYTAPMGFAAAYAHWAEIMILGLASFLGPLIVPGHIVTIWVWFIVRQMEGIETHSGYEFPWNPLKWIPFYGGAAFHDYHHFVGGQTNCNFASVFTYCDYIYGTNKGYRYQKKILKKVA